MIYLQVSGSCSVELNHEAVTAYQYYSGILYMHNIDYLYWNAGANIRRRYSLGYEIYRLNGRHGHSLPRHETTG